jgi:regulator of sirC expression with transglutaminase-like and TPR domain
LTVDALLQAFCAVVGGPERAIDLAAGAFEIARIEHPDLVPALQLPRLERLAARSGAAAIADPLKALHRLREFLFEEEGFAGNVEDYYDPHNSCLNDVLDRRLGIPITLAVLVIEVGRRVGLPIRGVGLPGHFIVRVEVGPEPVLLDPFDGGAVLTPERAADVMARALGRRIPLNERHLAPVTTRQILVRMLLNLRGIYLRRGQWTRALAVLDRLLVLDGSAAVHYRDRGTVLCHLGQLHRAAVDWERYLARCPEAEDAPAVRRQLRQVRVRMAGLN